MDFDDATAGWARREPTLLRIARTLPLFSLGMRILTIWVPVLDSRDDFPMRIGVSSVGSMPFYLSKTDLEAVVAWSCLFVSVAGASLLPRLRIWSVSTAVLGVVFLIELIETITDPNTAFWDGADAQGRPAGGLIVAEPALGAVFWALGALALVAAGVCGLLGEHRRRPRRHVPLRGGPSRGGPSTGDPYPGGPFPGGPFPGDPPPGG